MTTSAPASIDPVVGELQQKVSDLAAAPYNPRTITPEGLENLAASIREFGDLSGVVRNVRTNRLIGGHQRVKILDPSWPIDKNPIKDSTGTVAVGHIITAWGPFNYREVDWPEEKEIAANISANKIRSAWDDLKLTPLLVQMDTGGFKLELTGFHEWDIKKRLAGEDAAALGRVLFTEDEILDDAADYFMARGFPYPVLELFEMKIQLNKLANLPPEKLRQTTVAYRVADSFNRHRFSKSALGMKSPLEIFKDRKLLRRTLEVQAAHKGDLTAGHMGVFNIASRVQSCSNFRPGYARLVMEKYGGEGAVVFDPCMGYGGRLVGFLASTLKTYISTDPCKETFEANRNLVRALGVGRDVRLFNKPVEDLDVGKFAGICDLAFTSPPYFKKEIYSDEKTQSAARYPEYGRWLDGFLLPMFRQAKKMLKKTGVFVLNIQDVKIGSKKFSLVDDSIAAGQKAGFVLKEREIFELPVNPFDHARYGEEQVYDGQIKDESAETVLVFSRP